VRAETQGFIQVEGQWYCPMMPVALINATIDYRAKRTDRDTYDRRVAERRTYRARRKQSPDQEGHVRLQCPAAGASPVVRCELKPRSIRRAPAGRQRVVVDDEIRTAPPACCTAETVTVPPAAGAKFAQEHPYASPEWQERYNTLRNATEGANGFLKDPAHEALDAGPRRVHGVAAQSLFVAFLILAANVRKIRSFMEKIATDAGRLRRIRPRRRRTKPLADWPPKIPVVDNGSDPDPPRPA
jgi:hypothetical protein